MSPAPRKVDLWFDDDRRRSVFELGARHHFDSLVARSTGRRASRARAYEVTICVPDSEAHHVKIEFNAHHLTHPEIRVDGPTESPHRYPDGSLCLWWPNDPEAQRWVVADGLLHLLRLIAVHLLREDWWRDFEEWLGPEVLHGPRKESPVGANS